jgi:hypothetical protein
VITPALGAARQLGGALGVSPVGVTAQGWWLAGGISAANCVAAYQPKGAADLAASYINLANPGTNNAAPGVAPTWNAATGWAFGSGRYLNTGIVTPASPTWTYLVRFTNGDGGSLLGSTDGSNGVTFFPNRSGARSYSHYGVFGGFPIATSGIMGIAGNKAYLDGAAEAGTISAGANPNYAIWIGGRNFNGALNQPVTTAQIQAIAIYNTTLSGAQVAAVTSAMQAL